MSLPDFANKWSTELTRHIPPGQFGRYLLVGAWNALFDYGTFALFTAVLNPFVPHSSGIVLGLIALPVLVFLIRRNTFFFAEAPYIAGAPLMVVVVFFSFFGHKKFSFRSPA